VAEALIKHGHDILGRIHYRHAGRSGELAREAKNTKLAKPEVGLARIPDPAFFLRESEGAFGINPGARLSMLLHRPGAEGDQGPLDLKALPGRFYAHDRARREVRRERRAPGEEIEVRDEVRRRKSRSIQGLLKENHPAAPGVSKHDESRPGHLDQAGVQDTIGWAVRDAKSAGG
jgi:hypothetical protein